MPRVQSRKVAKEPRKGRRSKYGAIRTVYRGVEYASRSEACYARHLDMLVKAGEVDEWRAQVRVPLVVKGVMVATIVPDFFVSFADGSSEYHEVKGVETAIWRLKRKLFTALFPNEVYKVVKAREALAL